MNQAGSLLDKLSLSTVALSVCLSTPSKLALAHLEKNVNALREEWSELLDEIAPYDAKRNARTLVVAPDEYNAFIRSVVAFSSFIQVLSRPVGERVDLTWGRHLFGDLDFELASFEPLDLALSDRAIGFLAPGLGSDLLGAVDELLPLWPARPYMYKENVRRAVEECCQEVGGTSVPAGLGFGLQDPKSVAVTLGKTEDEVLTMASERRLVSVPMWAGPRMFPDFQFDSITGAVLPVVSEVLASTSDGFKDWALAIWLHRNHVNGIGRCRDQLSDRGLWTPDWDVPACGAFNGIISPPTHEVTATKPLFRVARRGYTPFFFSFVKPAPAGTPPPPAGRFDLSEISHRGSLYLSEDPVGAWAEVLDREPVVTLADVAHRDSWTLTPTQDIQVADLTNSASKLASHKYRADTQELAEGLSGRFAGLRTALRTRVSSRAVVLFGVSGPTLPESAGIGLWSSERRRGFRDEALWEYLDERARFTEDFPTVLRRFPDDLRLTV